MSIKVRYFASLKELLGRAEDELTNKSVSTVADVWGQVSDGIKAPENTLAAVNMEYVGFECQVVDGDEVAFFPPVTGG
jgi:molybdopterin synthase sulfur carrier subunit